jgi:hypothetical protein
MSCLAAILVGNKSAEVSRKQDEAEVLPKIAATPRMSGIISIYRRKYPLKVLKSSRLKYGVSLKEESRRQR